jgi:hypothetical protein
MNQQAVQPGVLEERAEELRAVLQEQSDALERRSRQLEELSECVRSSDNERMESLLARMEEAQALQSAADARLAGARRELAQALGRPAGRVHLADLLPGLPPAIASVLAGLRARIFDQVNGLRRKHLQAAVLLSESARVNRLLLQCFLPQRPAVTLYDRGGPRRWGAGRGLLDEAR